MKSKYDELAALLYLNDTFHHHDKKRKHAAPERDVSKVPVKKMDVLAKAIGTIKASVAFIIYD